MCLYVCAALVCFEFGVRSRFACDVNVRGRAILQNTNKVRKQSTHFKSKRCMLAFVYFNIPNHKPTL
jgi:hypothetical protein